MLLLKAFVLSMVFSYGSSQVKLTQPQQSMTREESKTIRIDCRVSVRNFDQAYIHWYKQRPGAAPERILYISTQAAFDRASDKGKFNAEKKKIGQPTCTLIIDKTSFSDTATYYCAYWDHTVLENSTPPVQKSTLLFKTQVCQYGAAQEQLTQTQISITKIPKKTVKMDYKIFGIDVGGAYIHWYGQRPGEAPEWLLYYKTQNDQSSFDKDKFSIDKTSGKPICTLTVDKLTYNDTATYYCATWYTSTRIKSFGTGTQLVVSGKEAKFDPKKIQTLFLTEQDGKGTHMCLIEDFFPNVIKVTWKSSNEEKNAIRGEIWSPDDKQNSYSVSSWLTVDDPNKTYNLTYEHESGRDSILLQSQGTSRAIEGCINMLPADLKNSFTHTTAYLIYIILLLKSTMYYVIVLFFIYRMKDPNKHQGKKP